MAGSADGERSAHSASAGRRPRVALVALGCRVNRADTDALAAELGSSFELAREGEPADLVVVNTCALTVDAASAGRQAIRRAARLSPGTPIVAAGCYAEVAPEDLRSLPGVAAVLGTRSQGAIAEALRRLAYGSGLEIRGGPSGVRSAGGLGSGGGAAEALGGWGRAPEAPARHTRPFLKVQDGCDQRCSYCLVPQARGASRSLPFEDALRRIALLGARHPEVVLTGVHLGAYGQDLSPRRSLADLIQAVAGSGAVHRLRLSSVEPNELPLEIVGPNAAVCAHYHLPLQSGSARVLAAMRRPYGPERFCAIVTDLAARIPGACIGTDVLVGFPGETQAEHRATVDLVESLPLAYLHVFPFSPRPGTAAAALPGRIPAATLHERARELLAISERRWRGFVGAQVGRELEVVVERIAGGMARGTAREWVTVRWPEGGEVRGTLARVRIEASDGRECVGCRVSSPPADGRAAFAEA